MINPYIIILSLFLIAGLIATAWGWRIIALGRKTLSWPSVEGIITTSRESSFEDSGHHDLLPNIEYCYVVNDKNFRQKMQFPGDITPTKEFTQSYLEKYPIGKKVTVYYHPEIHEQATLEIGPGKGDWLVLTFGLGATVLGIIFLFFG